MSIVKINAITVPRDRFEEFAQRFATRAGKVEESEGFEGFQLLRPNDDRELCLVITQWRDEESFQAWVSSPDFAAGHAQHRAGGPVGPAQRAVVVRRPGDEGAYPGLTGREASSPG